ncbi:MAG: ATP-binding domain-containing protein [Helicobacteraceae bacterium]|jgi:hypothetical protein|nr:ATP-binding domain-containing protein [Helicobacteraceae bacterium]
MAGKNSGIRLNIRELKQNYRSSQKIVKFTNAIQLFRSYRFDLDNIEPQSPWNNAYSTPVVWYSPGDANFWNAIKETNAVFIIPCDNGGEKEWIKQDEYLSNKNVNYMTISQSKGLEFSVVVAYRLGCGEIDKLIKPPGDEKIITRLPLEYLINRVYVGISRAKKRLIVVADDEEKKLLWRVTYDAVLINQYLAIKKKWNNSDIEPLVISNVKEYDSQEINEASSLAKDFESSGFEHRNPITLKQAANNYSRLPNESGNANKCYGFASLFEQRYDTAAVTFEKSGWYGQAICSYWLDENYEKVVDIINKQPNYNNNLLYDVSIARAKDTDTDILKKAIGSAADLKLLKNVFNEDDYEYFPKDKCYEVLDKALGTIIGDIITRDLADRAILDKIIQIADSGIISVDHSQIAMIAYAVHEDKTAVSYWEKNLTNEIKKSEEYRMAKAKTVSFPENVKLFYDLKQYDMVVKAYEKRNSDQILSSDIYKMIILVYLELGSDNEALSIFPENIKVFYDLKQYDMVVKAYEKRNSDQILSSDNNRMITFAYSTLNKLSNALSILANITNPIDFYLIRLDLKNLNDIERKKELLDLCDTCEKLSNIISEKWEDIIDLNENKDRDTKYNGIPKLYIALALAQSNFQKSKLSRDKCNAITGFLEREFLENTSYIEKRFTLDIGVAVEKACCMHDGAFKHTKALQYYEDITRIYSKDIELVRKCEERWIVSKERQAYRDKNTEKKNEILEEANRKRKQFDLVNIELPEYLNTEHTGNTLALFINDQYKDKVQFNDKNKNIAQPTIPVHQTSIRTKVEFNFEGYRFEYFYEKHRLNITNENNSNQLTITADGSRSDDYKIENHSIEAIGECKKKCRFII